VPITLPDLGTPEATVSVWYVGVGEQVFEGDRVIEVLIRGATFDVPSPVTGFVRDRHVLPGDVVTTGQVLGIIDPDTDE
jgi:pyruvate dehydrogenase E2 component (dihydrolipoamide acetyltransferase)